MAVTKILARRGGLQQAIAYVLNGDKTEEQILTAVQGCLTSTACHDMVAVKQRWNKTDGVQLYHIIQSFRPGEITPELALEIAQEFVREHLPGYWNMPKSERMTMSTSHRWTCCSAQWNEKSRKV